MLKKLYKTKTTEVHKAYQKYVKKTKAAGKKPRSFAYWSREPVYFRGVTAAKKKLYKPSKKKR